MIDSPVRGVVSRIEVTDSSVIGSLPVGVVRFGVRVAGGTGSVRDRITENGSGDITPIKVVEWYAMAVAAVEFP